MECLRTCDYDNIALNLRAFGADLQPQNKPKLDEAYKAFIMLSSALIYSAVMLGPWGFLKNAAYQVGTLPWLAFAGSLLALTWGVLPGIFFLITRKRSSFITFSASLLPLGLTAWVAFSFSFVFANISYLWPVISDPFGWGWNIFGTAGLTWSPYLGNLVPALQIVALIAGLLWSASSTQKIAAGLHAPRRAWPVMAFSLLTTLMLLGLLIA